MAFALLIKPIRKRVRKQMRRPLRKTNFLRLHH